MTLPEFAETVRAMRRDQKTEAAHLTPASAMKARYSERIVDTALDCIQGEATESRDEADPAADAAVYAGGCGP